MWPRRLQASFVPCDAGAQNALRIKSTRGGVNIKNVRLSFVVLFLTDLHIDVGFKTSQHQALLLIFTLLNQTLAPRKSIGTPVAQLVSGTASEG
jgi:hypothetical protein